MDSTRAPGHALSVDVEDWYHDDAVALACPPQERVEANTDWLLEIFAEHGARATFFFLGQVAERFPALVRRVCGAGHEIGSHGYAHLPLSQQLRREFRADVERSLRVIEDITGAPVRGYRAPCFSISADVRWPIETLAELGVGYDSSILAIDRAPGLELVCPRHPFRHPSGVWEVPVAVLRFFVWHLPLASGAGLRLVPPPLLWRSLERFEREVGTGLFYLHPWELDCESPTAALPSRWLLRVGRARLPGRLGALLKRRTFAPIGEVFAAQLGAAPAVRTHEPAPRQAADERTWSDGE